MWQDTDVSEDRSASIPWR